MSINQLVDLTGLNYRTIKNRLKPIATVREDGRSHFYDTRDALKLLYPTVATEMAKENLLLERARREKAEIEVGQLKGQLVPIADVGKVIRKEYSYVRSQLRAMPSNMAKPLSMISDAHLVYKRLSEAVDECLTELTADAKYELERTRIEATSKPDVDVSFGRTAADTEIESGRMGGQVSVPESRVEFDSGEMED